MLDAQVRPLKCVALARGPWPLAAGPWPLTSLLYSLTVRCGVCCATEPGDDEGTIWMTCTPDSEPKDAFFTRNKAAKTASLSDTCPAGSWALFAWAWHTSSDFGEASEGCFRRVSTRTCTSESYSAWGETFNNPAKTCSKAYCDGGWYDAGGLLMLCMCLPGHARDGAACSPCLVGETTDDTRSSCIPCPEGHYCVRPDQPIEECGVGLFLVGAMAACVLCVV